MLFQDDSNPFPYLLWKYDFFTLKLQFLELSSLPDKFFWKQPVTSQTWCDPDDMACLVQGKEWLNKLAEPIKGVLRNKESK